MNNRCVVEFGIQIPVFGMEWETITNIADRCDASALDYLTVPDHSIYIWEPYECWTTLGYLACRTKRIKLVSMTSDVFRHHPAILAQMASSIDVMSNGRFNLGISYGEAMNLDCFGVIWDRPLRRYREAAELIRRLLSEAPNPVDYEGEIYKVRGGRIMKSIKKPHVPLWIAGNSPKTREIAAKIGDVWIAGAYISPKTLGKYLKEIREIAAEAGRDPNSIRACIYNHLSVDDDRERARELIEGLAKAHSLLFPQYLREEGYDATDRFSLKNAQLHDSNVVNELFKESERVPFEGLIEKMIVWGNPDDCVTRINEYVANGADIIILRPVVPREYIESIVKEFISKVLIRVRPT